MTYGELLLFFADLCATTGIALNRNAKGLKAKARKANRETVEALYAASNNLMEAAARLPTWLSTYAFTPEDNISLFTTPDTLLDSFPLTLSTINPHKAKRGGKHG